MSKIAEALQKAKERRNHHTEEFQEQTAFQTVYSQTRVVSLKHSHLRKYRLYTLLDDAAPVDRYNVIATKILEKTCSKGHNTIMVTSCSYTSRKTFIAINLAVAIAKRSQHTVLLVDMDLRRPKIQCYLGLHNQKGLSDYLENSASISELLINPGLEKMVVLPAGRPLQNSAAISESTKIEKLVWEMKSRYPERYVIFDCPPLLLFPDSLAFSSFVDGIILVVEAGKTPRSQIREAVELLKGKNLLGLAMNKGRCRANE